MRATLSRLVLTALLVFCPLLAAAQTSQKATVAFLKGKAVAIDAKGLEKPLKVGDALAEGGTVSLLNKGSRMVLKFSDGTELRLKGKTEMKFTRFNRSDTGKTRKTQLQLVWGNFWAKVAKLATKNSKFEVKAGGVVCGVRGTVIGGDYNPGNGSGNFYNFGGNVYTDNGNGPHNLPEGYHQFFTGGQYGSQGPNKPGDSNQYQFGGEGNGPDDGGGSSSSGSGNGGNGVLGDVTGDLGGAVNNAHNNNHNSSLGTRKDVSLQLQFTAPEGVAGGGT